MSNAPIDQATLEAVVAKVAGMLHGASVAPAGSFGASPMPVSSMGVSMNGGPTPCGISFPITVQRPDGSSLRGYLHFGQEYCQNPQTIQQLAAILPQICPMVQPYYQRQENGGGNRGGGYNGGGYSGGGRRW